MLLDPEDPGGALFRMWRVTPRLSPLIRAEAFMRYLTKQEPQRALAWLSASRRMMCDHGEWRFEPTGRAAGSSTSWRSTSGSSTRSSAA